MDKLPRPKLERKPKNSIEVIEDLKEGRLEWLGALASQKEGSWDGERNERQARSNLDYLLDHFPNGSPRDHIVAYSEESATVLVRGVPGNITQGAE